MKLMRSGFIVLPVIAIVLGTTVYSQAGYNLLSNGNFASTTGGTASQTSGQLNYTSVSGGTAFNLANWTSSSSGYNFLMNSGTPTATGQYGALSLWYSGSSGLTNSSNTWNGSAPGGGNYIAADGDFGTVPISQTLTTLTVGQVYQVGFWWAGAQQTGYTTASTDQWQVSLASQTQTQTQVTSVYSNPGEGFSGWMYVKMDFTATATTETLSFLAIGTPTGVPPFSLLDGVTMTAVPEPSSLLLLGLGLLGVGVVRRRRRIQSSVV